MKYKDLLENLKSLSEEQLNQDVILLPEEGRGLKISTLEILHENLYTDREYPEEGCYLLPLEWDQKEHALVYSKGTPILT